ncbi:exopolysaccharide biosynthesis WecB/TagA/CpsF family protein [Pseudarthrobacter enclensis]|uniref:Exopolysaccharide biosynthesis WecB/TagA/CpsF family protein n=2 Tax=Pseudarthrobacter enclensis TaxID=993070 RepID=A0ABT9RX52_9MICC|nr:exopolysaccharide biosynthesis WecB/TagA/CpsF family protein [Pseudarthrobacter enclensis]
MSPPFSAMSPREYESQDRRIEDTNPDIVWVGLGTPKQDFEAQRLATAGNFFAVAVGAAFDFSAGTKKEAPRWITALGFEWLFRLAAEPKRLWRRYLIGNFVFLYSVIRRGL